MTGDLGMKKYSRVYAAVNLDALTHNMEAMQANLSEGTSIIGVVKTDGYGHGSVPVALAIDPYVKGYAVASVDEAVILRKHGIQKMILVLGVTHESRYEDLIRYKIRPAMFQYDKVHKLSDLAQKMEERADIHVAVDTGMNRIGLRPDKESAKLVADMSRLPGIRIEGMFTHFARADEKDKAAAELQLEKYLNFTKWLEGLGVQIPIRHCSNSAGIIDLKQANLDMVRAGISIYGLYPSEEVNKEVVKLEPALELKSFITYIKKIDAGDEVSYGGTFTADHNITLATVPVGYGDGYPRNLSGCGEVLIRGKRAPILGRICMDQLMVDVSLIGDACEDDEVTLIGQDGNEWISVEELAERGGGFHYEILCDIGKRVPRVYTRGGNIVGTKDYFDDTYIIDMDNNR